MNDYARLSLFIYKMKKVLLFVLHAKHRQWQIEIGVINLPYIHVSP